MDINSHYNQVSQISKSKSRSLLFLLPLRHFLSVTGLLLLLDDRHALLGLAFGWGRQAVPHFLLSALPFSLDSGREGARTAEVMVLRFRSVSKRFVGRLSLFDGHFDVFNEVFFLELIIHFFLWLMLAWLWYLNWFLRLSLQLIVMRETVVGHSLSLPLRCCNKAMYSVGNLGLSRYLEDMSGGRHVSNDLRTMLLLPLVLRLPLNLLPDNWLLFLLPFSSFLLILLICPFLYGRNLDMRDHEPIIIGVCEIDGIITGISGLGEGKEVISFWRVEFKSLLHLLLNIIVRNHFMIFSMNSLNSSLWS